MASSESHTGLAPALEASGWRERLERVLDDPDLVRPVFQPIFDLGRGLVCGYEALARFALEPRRSPEAWLAAADEQGLSAELEAAMLLAGLRKRSELPENCFLTVNVSPSVVLSDAVQAVIEGSERLDAIVVELTEREPVQDYDSLRRALETLRERGAMIAVDDAGAGYASLQHIMSLRPEFIKLDRALVSGVDDDGAKLALVEAVGSFATRIDAWVVAEGIEHGSELDAVRTLGVPLGQGYGLALPRARMDVASLESAPQSPPTTPRAECLETIMTRPVPLQARDLAHAAERLAGERSAEFLVVVDELGRPSSLLRGSSRPRGRHRVISAPMLRVLTSEPPEEVARRAMTRPREQRFDPVIACDERGRFKGVVAIDQLVHLLSRTISERTHR